MEEDYTVFKDFGCVPCGQKIVESIKHENKTKKTQFLEVRPEIKNSELSKDGFHLSTRFYVHPVHAVVQPKQTVCFKVVYCSFVENETDIFSFDICEDDTTIRRLKFRAKSVGPAIHPETINLKFFRFRNLNKTVKHVELINTTKNEAKYYFDKDEDYKYLEISQERGTIPGGLKLVLKLTFNATELGVYYKKIFCIIQFHKPIIFNIIAVIKPKLKLELKNLNFRHPLETEYANNYEAYMCRRVNSEPLDGEKIQTLLKCLEDLDLGDITKTSTENNEQTSWTSIPESPHEAKHEEPTTEVFLTENFVDIKNAPEVLAATGLINVSECQYYYYEWDHDPEDHFQISPCRGVITPKTKVDFAVYFTPTVSDRLYHAELDVKVFYYDDESQTESNTIELPLMMSLRIIGHSFPEESCGWVPQCKITPKILHMHNCVPGEKTYATFIIERDGHLPVNFSVLPTENQNFTVYPTIGYLSKNFQLFVVQFVGEEPGVYMEDVKIKYNNSDINIGIIKLSATVEIPLLTFGKDNTVTLMPVLPGSKVSTEVDIKNTTNLFLSYECQIPKSMTWIEIVNPTGSLEPKTSGKLRIIFKPDISDEYVDYISCKITSVCKLDYSEVVQLKVIGSCQFGYLVATPSIHDFGTCIYKRKSVIQIHLFNFSLIVLYFQLKAVNDCFPPGNADKSLTIIPDKGEVPSGGSLQIEVSLTPIDIGYYEYAILCQNCEDDSDTANPCEFSRKIIFLKVNTVLPCIQISDIGILNGGPLFSPHMLWEMLRVDEINETLRSPNPNSVIKAKIPELMRGSTPVILTLMIDTWYEKLVWSVDLQIQCPSYAESSSLIDDCVQTKTMLISPNKHTTQPGEKKLLHIKINYDLSNEALILFTIKLPHKRQVELKIPLVPLPNQPPPCISSYLDPKFSLKPVFIGDPQPPLQLFWLYNSTETPASYSVNLCSLRECFEQKIFDFINPEGVIPAFSPHPLGIIFSPMEMITYSAVVPVQLGKSSCITLELNGEGELQTRPFVKTANKNICECSVTLLRNGDLECCEKFLNIPFIGTHSKEAYLFFIENTSKTEQWSFEWSRYKFENIFSVRIEPEKGLLGPNEKAVMTLFLQTYWHPTSISFSVACKTSSFTQLTAYNEAIKLKEAIAKQEEQEFTITEKGTTFEATELPEIEKPLPCHTFMTVKANIVSNSTMEQIATKKLWYAPKAQKEIQKNLKSGFSLTPSMLYSVQELLEKLLWDILCHRNVVEKIKESGRTQDLIYKHIVPQSQKKKEELTRLFGALPSTHFIQNILESTIQELLCKNYIPPKKTELDN